MFTGWRMWERVECSHCGSRYKATRGGHNRVRYLIWRLLHV